MLNWTETEVAPEATRFTDKTFLVFDGHVPIMTFGIQRYSLLTKQYYVWIKPTRHMEARHIRLMRREMRHFDGAILFANVEQADHRAVRFAKLLGFVVKATAQNTLYCERIA